MITTQNVNLRNVSGLLRLRGRESLFDGFSHANLCSDHSGDLQISIAGKSIDEIIYRIVMAFYQSGRALPLGNLTESAKVLQIVQEQSEIFGEAEEATRVLGHYGELHEAYREESNRRKVIELEKSRERMHDLINEGFSSLVGIEDVRAVVEDFAAMHFFNQVRQVQGKKPIPQTKHLVMVGNPGTGKTSVARIIARLYHEIGITTSSAITEVSRSDLIGDHIGATEKKCKAIFQEAQGGVLFIDEAYSLAVPNGTLGTVDYGKRVIDQLVVEAENKRLGLTIILAGYPLEMQSFLETNPGLRSRFPITINFADYGKEALEAILFSMLEEVDLEADFVAADGVEDFRQELAKAQRLPSFGNARWVRNYVESVTRDRARVAFRLSTDLSTDLGTQPSHRRVL